MSVDEPIGHVGGEAGVVSVPLGRTNVLLGSVSKGKRKHADGL
jgi:hypothetical protein